MEIKYNNNRSNTTFYYVRK